MELRSAFNTSCQILAGSRFLALWSNLFAGSCWFQHSLVGSSRIQQGIIRACIWGPYGAPAPPAPSAAKCPGLPLCASQLKTPTNQSSSLSSGFNHHHTQDGRQSPKKLSYSSSSSARYIYRSTDAFWCRLMLKGIKGTSSRLRRQIKAGVRKWKNDQTRPVKSF